MKKTIVILFYTLSLCCGFSQNQVLFKKDFKQDYINIKYSRNQICADIEFMLHIIKKSHPNFYHNFTKTELKHCIDSLLLALPDSLNIYKSSLAISQLLSKFNEGHLGLLYNNKTMEYYYSIKNRFPYIIFNTTDRVLIVRKDLSILQNLQIGDTILSINNLRTDSLIIIFEQYFGGFNEWRLYQVKNQFGYLLFASDIKAPFRIKARHNGKIINFITDGEIIPAPKMNDQKKADKNYKYSIIDSNIAYLNFYSMFDLKAFKDSLKITFNDIVSKNISNLIVDLRYNRGGNSDLGVHLLTYFNEKPYRLASSNEIKISKPVKQSFRMQGIPGYWKTFSYIIPNGIKWTVKFKPEKKQVSEPSFKGNVVFLIGTGTFSSANLLANGIQDYKLATLIGESTLEPCNDYGDIIRFMLPNTQLIACAPFKYFVRANGDKIDANGVIPDYTICSSISDMILGKDLVLDFAKIFIRNKK
jgi:C-terminal processing protease CtpA/Prc